MPSYIEFDKEPSLPASSNAGRVIFGIDSAGQAVVVDSLGNNLPLSQSFVSASYAVTASYALNGGGGGGSTPVTPNALDYAFVYSYGRWMKGTDGFPNINKFDYLDTLASPGEYIQLTLVGGQVNGVNFSIYPTQSVIVPQGGVVYRNDYDGLVPVNYIDFVNGLFVSHSLYTRITGSATMPYSNAFYADYCRTDNFAFFFSETGNIPGLNVPNYYSLFTLNGFNLVEGYGVLYNNQQLNTQILNFQIWNLV